MNLLISCDCKSCRRSGCDIVTIAMASKSVWLHFPVSASVGSSVSVSPSLPLLPTATDTLHFQSKHVQSIATCSTHFAGK